MRHRILATLGPHEPEPGGEHEFWRNKLHSYKSNFQAWKCVSFGCSLLAMVLLAAKWHEVCTDFQLLIGIDRLLSAQAMQNGANSSVNGTNGTSTVPLVWPPVPLEQLLPAANESNFGMESLETNGTMLMSHLHMSLSRELTGEQLLRQEVGAFLVEFRNAKSTLGLSSLLVSVYIVSWILMTLAINDTRISNDISLRNILLLSVFGAIDLAASVGFVMVRLIMFTVKNNSFASEILSSGGLKELPVRLSADQLTAFTALRLIAMRSCSAYVDVYVSVLMGLLTVLRLYAILKALAYYRHLRQMSDYRRMSEQLSHELADGRAAQQQQHQRELLNLSHQQQQQMQLANGTAAGGAPGGGQPKQIWSSSLFGPSAGQFYTDAQGQQQPPHMMISPQQLQQPSAHSYLAADMQHQQHQRDPSPAASLQRHSSHPAPLMDPSGAISEPERSVAAQHQRRQQRRRTPDLISLDAKLATLCHPSQAQVAPPEPLVMFQTGAGNGIARQQPRSLRRPPPEAQRARRTRAASQEFKFGATNGPPNLLLVNGRAHRLVTEAEGQSEPIARRVDASHSDSAPLPEGVSFRSLPDQSAGCPSTELAQSGPEQEQQQRELSGVFGARLIGGGESSEQSLLAQAQAADSEPVGEPRSGATRPAAARAYNTVRSNGTTYTLLSAQQLERISHKLLHTSTLQAPRSSSGASSGTSGTRYKLVARYRQVKPGSLLIDPALAQVRPARGSGSLGQEGEESSSSSCGPDDSDHSAKVAAVRRTAPGRARQRQQAATLTSDLRHTEEFVTADSVEPQEEQYSVGQTPGQTRAFASSAQQGAGANLLLGKYYYYT